MVFSAAIYLTEEDYYIVAIQGCIEGMHSGITTIVDYIHNRPGLIDGIVKAYKELGIRGYIERSTKNPYRRK